MIFEKFSMKGKIGIVTGGGTGLGKGMATALVQPGNGIMIVGRKKKSWPKRGKDYVPFAGRSSFLILGHFSDPPAYRFMCPP